jgi:hypothetical protein
MARFMDGIIKGALIGSQLIFGWKKFGIFQWKRCPRYQQLAWVIRLGAIRAECRKQCDTNHAADAPASPFRVEVQVDKDAQEA